MGKASREAATLVPTWRHRQGDSISRSRREAAELSSESSMAYRRDIAEGRWVIQARLGRRRWEVIVEPAFSAGVLLVITAYPISER